MTAQQLLHLGVNRRRKLKGHWASLGKVEELLKLTVFRPIIHVPLIRHIFAFVPPSRNSRILCRIGAASMRPEIHDHGLTRRKPVEPLDRNGTVSSAEILAKAEMGVMRC